MHLISSLGVNHIITYLAIFFITSSSPTNANAIPPWAAFTPANLNQLDARDGFQNSIIEGVPVLDDRSLIKRGGCMSRGGGNQQVDYVCSPEPPSVDDCADKIRDWGKVAAKTPIYYTKLQGWGGLKLCKQYFNCNPVERPVVGYDDIVDNRWFMAQGQAIRDSTPSQATFERLTDQFQKRLSQAFAQEANGVAYICTPEGESPDNNFPTTSTWGGWEYPALTRNPAITKVMRVDPATSVMSQIWTKGQPATVNLPQG
jgi:hypothetical protein